MQFTNVKFQKIFRPLSRTFEKIFVSLPPNSEHHEQQENQLSNRTGGSRATGRTRIARNRSAGCIPANGSIERG